MPESQSCELSSAAAVKVGLVEDSFRHEALFYNGEDGFLGGTLPFVREALEAREAVLVAVVPERAELLERALGADASRVRFLDMRELGRNPARLIPAWRKFLAECQVEGCPVRGIGESVWAGRSEDELEECERYEALLNRAFSYGPSWRLLCPYDLDALGAEAIRTARMTHPAAMHEGVSRRNSAYRPLHRAPGPFGGSLPNPPAEREQLSFTAHGLGAIRSLVAKRATEAGLAESPREDLVLAVNELVTNSVQHGGGGGTLRIWREPDAFVCEVRDRGFIEDPLVGRLPPPVDQHGGRGLWLVNHLCDLVQIRSSPDGTVIRVHMRISA
ncbi:MAG TPA: anti-sigma factor RsbA family regulatory protein [Solirubrobacteraceae bacterium]|nr:anti-sigma factor RsbA family regulatory protein [Solirubrobacteraceae bacterium]